jgi:hypothetical protein
LSGTIYGNPSRTSETSPTVIEKYNERIEEYVDTKDSLHVFANRAT